MHISDGPAAVTVTDRAPLYSGFRMYESIGFDGPGIRSRREQLHVGKVVAVLPYDPDADTVVLLRQFRLGAHMATGDGDMIEIVAGLVEAGEDPRRAAQRETQEEIRVAVGSLKLCFDFLPSPGFSDEYAHLYCGRVDSSQVPDAAGLASEGEVTRPFLLPAKEAIELANRQGGIRNGFTRLALLWFASNRGKIRRQWRRKASQSA